REVGKRVRTEVLARVEEHDEIFPIHGLVFGPEDRTRPAFGLFAGVHGIERVGTEIALTFLESIVARLRWDRDLRHALRKCRIVAIPMVNPAGIRFRHRCNHRGVDLMRNAPVQAQDRTPLLVGGHRISPKLPWFRGRGEMEPEAQALTEFVRRELFPSRACLSLDLHSGFGVRDRLWYPYAKTAAPPPTLPQILAFVDLLDRSLPHHVYRVEPQSASYCTHGDLWDHLLDSHLRSAEATGTFMPWTLEIGSWIWVRKNPSQLFRYDGPFNPIKPHRHGRAMRRHMALLDFCFRAIRNHRRWLHVTDT
ncbi:MAG: M14 family zinc carboxypeptidase, partial [Myxococcota bacterium]